jgi:hypothetical protein
MLTRWGAQQAPLLIVVVALRHGVVVAASCRGCGVVRFCATLGHCPAETEVGGAASTPRLSSWWRHAAVGGSYVLIQRRALLRDAGALGPADKDVGGTSAPPAVKVAAQHCHCVVVAACDCDCDGWSLVACVYR